jgi:hypothetical protein
MHLKNALYAEEYDSYVLILNEINCLQESCDVLEFFDSITVSISGETYSTCSLIKP